MILDSTVFCDPVSEVWGAAVDGRVHGGTRGDAVWSGAHVSPDAVHVTDGRAVTVTLMTETKDSLSTKRTLQRKLKQNVAQLWTPIPYAEFATPPVVIGWKI